MSVAGISQIIAAENRNVPSGSIDIGSESFSLRVEKEFKDPSELLDVVVSYRGGQVVYLKDVARVEDGLEEKSQESYTNGNRSAMIAIQKQSGANTVNVVNAAKQRIAEIAPTLPSDIKITEVVDNSSEILNTINSLKETIIITLLVVMLVVFVFLGRWRATFIIVLSIPIALLGSLVYLFATGNTLNIISMSALSIAIGMVVDDAIVVLENISTHLERGEKPKEAAVHATSEVGISVIASTLTMLCVFLPLTMVSGMAGIMFKQLGWIVSIIMIISTTAAFVAAGAGVKIAKHGNVAATSKCGAADVLRTLGADLSLPPSAVRECFDKTGVAFLFAQRYHSGMRFAANVRRYLGFKTLFNLLGPLTNPAKVKRCAIGVYDPKLVPLIAETLKRLGYVHALVFSGVEGMDEISPFGLSMVSVPLHLLLNAIIQNDICKRQRTDVQQYVAVWSYVCLGQRAWQDDCINEICIQIPIFQHL